MPSGRGGVEAWLLEDQQRSAHFLMSFFLVFHVPPPWHKAAIHFLCHISLEIKCKLTVNHTCNLYVVIMLLLQVTQTELERLKSSCRQAVRDAAQAKRKYQDASRGVCYQHCSLLWTEPLSQKWKKSPVRFSLCNAQCFLLFVFAHVCR